MGKYGRGGGLIVKQYSLILHQYSSDIRIITVIACHDS
jgi:hypothetical protein